MNASFPSIEFLFDRERDIRNIYDTCNASPKWGKDFSASVNTQLFQAAHGKRFEECKQELESLRRKLYDSSLIPVFLESIYKAWGSIASEYFARLERVTGQKLFTHKVTGYLTTVPKCPYNPREYSFMINFFDSLSGILRTIGHELLHLQFHEYFFKDIEKQIGHEKTHVFKEALTVLLNIEFKDLWFAKDQGYPEHQFLRTFIEEIWPKEKKFDVLLKKCILYVTTERKIVSKSP